MSLELEIRIKNEVSKEVKRIEKDLKRLNSTTKNTAKATSELSKSVKSLAGAYIGLYLVREVTTAFIRNADAMTLANSKLKLATGSTQELVQVQQELFNVSQATRTSFTSNIDLYQRMTLSTKELGLSQKELLDLSTTINKSMIVSGTSAEGVNTLVTQLGQAFSSNFQAVAQELGTLRDQSPRLYQAMLEGTGKTTSEFKKMAEQGKLTSKIIIEAIRSQSSSISEDFGKMDMTVAQSMVTVQNSATLLIGELDKELHLTKELSRVVRDMSRYIDDNRDSFIIAYGIMSAYASKLADGLVVVIRTVEEVYDAFARINDGDVKLAIALETYDKNDIAKTIRDLEDRLKANKIKIDAEFDISKKGLDGVKEAIEAKEFSIKIDLDTSSFDGVAKDLMGISKGFEVLGNEQKKYIEHTKSMKKDSEEYARAESSHTQNQIAGYSNLAGQISSTFKEGSKEAKAMVVVQTALSVATGLVAIANAGTGDPYTAIARVVAMIASLKSAGVALSGGGGSATPKNYTSTIEAANFGGTGGVAQGVSLSDYDGKFDKFIQGLDRASERLEDFGSSGTSLSNTFDAILDDIARLKREKKQDEFNIAQEQQSKDNSVEYAEIRTTIIERATKRIATATREIAQLSTQLFESMRESMIDTIDFDLFSFKELRDTISDTAYNATEYRKIQKEVNELAIEQKRAELEGGKISEAKQKRYIALIGTDIYTAGQDYSEAIERLQELNETIRELAITGNQYELSFASLGATQKEINDLRLKQIEEEKKALIDSSDMIDTGKNKRIRRRFFSFTVDIMADLSYVTADNFEKIYNSIDPTNTDLIKNMEAYGDLLLETARIEQDRIDAIEDNRTNLADRLELLNASTKAEKLAITRGRELADLNNEANKSLLTDIFLKEDELKISNERLDLQNQLNQLTMSETQLQQLQLDLLDSSNRAMQIEIWALEEVTKANEDFANSILNIGNSLNSAIDTIKGNLLDDIGSDSTSELIRQYNSAINKGDYELASNLATSISSGAFGDTSSLNKNLIASLEQTKLDIGFEDEILNVNIVSSDLATTEQSTPSVIIANQTATSNDTVEMILIELLKTNKRVETIMERIENNQI